MFFPFATGTTPIHYMVLISSSLLFVITFAISKRFSSGIKRDCSIHSCLEPIPLKSILPFLFKPIKSVGLDNFNRMIGTALTTSAKQKN